MDESVKRITANIPAKLLERAMETTGLGISETLVAGLEELERSRKRSVLRLLRGKVRFSLDLHSSAWVGIVPRGRCTALTRKGRTRNGPELDRERNRS